MNIEKSFANCDRYIFDFNYCHFKKGYAQLDTTEDAHYFGNWVNFKSLELITYCEGDITINKCDDVDEFKGVTYKKALLLVVALSISISTL